MKLNYKRTTLIGLAFMSILAFWQFYDQVIPYILENVFGLNTLKANSIMAIDNVLAIFMLPLFGAISDRTHTRLGKRTPYILYGTVAACVLMVLLALFENAVNFTGFFICLVLLLIVMSVYRSPAVAYMPDVTPKPLRSKGNAIINLMGTVGGMLTLVLNSIVIRHIVNENGEKVSDYTYLFYAVALIMAVSVFILFKTIHERPLVEEMERINYGETEAETAVTHDEKSGKLNPAVMRSLLLISTGNPQQ